MHVFIHVLPNSSQYTLCDNHWFILNAGTLAHAMYDLYTLLKIRCMKTVLQNHKISFQNALHGIAEAFRSHRNFRIHTILSLMAISGAFMLKITYTEFLIIIITIFFGLASEMINTSIESVTNLITKEWREDARIAKDVSAGMMLVVAVGAFIVAIIIFVPRIVAFFKIPY